MAFSARDARRVVSLFDPDMKMPVIDCMLASVTTSSVRRKSPMWDEDEEEPAVRFVSSGARAPWAHAESTIAAPSLRFKYQPR